MFSVDSSVYVYSLASFRISDSDNLGSLPFLPSGRGRRGIVGLVVDRRLHRLIVAFWDNRSHGDMALSIAYLERSKVLQCEARYAERFETSRISFQLKKAVVVKRSSISLRRFPYCNVLNIVLHARVASYLRT